jgi:hypothetical protein
MFSHKNDGVTNFNVTLRFRRNASQNELFLSTTINLTGKLRGEPIKMRFKD